MHSIHRICQSLARLPGRAGALLAYAAGMPAVLAAAPARPPGRHTHPHRPPGRAHWPHLPPGWTKHPPLPAHYHPAAGGGLPGWQITQLVAAAVLLAAAVAITVYRLRAARNAARGLGRRPIGTAAMTAFRLLPHTIQLCRHCRANPAGFWVRRTGDHTVRRPWCLTCCNRLDLGSCEVIAFDAAARTRPPRYHPQPGQTARPFGWPRARPARRPPS